MRRAISIALLVAFAAGCFAAANYLVKHQLAYATILHGHSIYYPPCQWTYKDDFAYIWEYDKTRWLERCSINAPPNYTYYLSGDWDGFYWLQGVTVSYYNEYWKLVELEPDQVRREDILFCWQMGQPDGGGN